MITTLRIIMVVIALIAQQSFFAQLLFPLPTLFVGLFLGIAWIFIYDLATAFPWLLLIGVVQDMLVATPFGMSIIFLLVSGLLIHAVIRLFFTQRSALRTVIVGITLGMIALMWIFIHSMLYDNDFLTIVQSVFYVMMTMVGFIVTHALVARSEKILAYHQRRSNIRRHL